uniref:Peptidase S1 domain-containing protein n=1 Tax=Astatotilapia calliptera TaxID=8154 RepID=A0A3P8QS65_ASTCA
MDTMKCILPVHFLIYSSRLIIVFTIELLCLLLSACGRANKNGRIVGGEDEPMLAFFSCGGSLITDQWVLTAAHFITPNAVTVTLENIICHPDYNALTYENDMCLLQVSTPVNFTDYIQPVCLASAGSTFYNGTSSWVTGFGDLSSGGSTPETLQEVNVPIVGNNECNCDLQNLVAITDNLICAGLKKDSCQLTTTLCLFEYSGVPLSGVLSFGDGCTLPSRTGVYARVSQYQNWIMMTSLHYRYIL